MLQWLILHHNTATGAAGSTLQTPFSGFKDRQVTQKRGPKKTGRLQNRREVVTKKEGRWQNTRLHSGPPHGRQRRAFHGDWELSIVMMTTSMSMMEGMIIIEV